MRRLISDHMVGFYFCFRDGDDGPLQCGHDEAARKLHARLLEGNRVGQRGLATGIPPAIVASPGGKKLLGLIDVQAQFDPEAFRKRLRAILGEHDYLELTDTEQQFVDVAERDLDAASFLRVAELYERVGNLEAARSWWRRVLNSDLPTVARSTAYCRLIEHARLADDWGQHADHLAAFVRLHDGANKSAALAGEQAAYTTLETAIREIRWRPHRDLEAASVRLTEALRTGPTLHDGAMHYYLGVALFLRQQQDEAYFHWWHFVNCYPNHPLHLKAYINLAAGSYPFPIAELDDYRGARSMTYGKDSPPQRERERTKLVYARVATTGYGQSFAIDK